MLTFLDSVYPNPWTSSSGGSTMAMQYTCMYMNVATEYGQTAGYIATKLEMTCLGFRQ